MTLSSGSDLELISLADLIEQVKCDLITKPSTTSPAFWIDEVRIEAKVVVRRTDTTAGKGGISLSVIGLKANAGIDEASADTGELTQSVSIRLSPLLSREEYRAGLDEESRRFQDSAAAAMVRGGNSEGDDV